MSPLRRRSIVGLAALAGLVAPPASAQESPTPLRPGVAIETEVAIDDAVRFTVDAAAGDLVELAAERSFGDLALRLTKADGTLVGAVSGTPSGGISLRLLRIVDGGGPLELAVTTSDRPSDRRGRFRLLLVERRASEPRDAERVAAFDLLHAASLEYGSAADETARGAAVDRIETAAARFRAIGAAADLAVALEALGEIHYSRGRTQEQAATTDAALAAWRAAGRRREEGRALSRVGLAAYVTFDRPKALAAYQAAFAIHAEAGDDAAAAVTQQRLGWCQRWIGDRHAAIAAYDRALPLFARVGDWQGEIGVLADLGLVQLELGDLAAAAARLQRALELADPERDLERMPNLLSTLAIVQLRSGELQAGVATCRRGIDFAARTGNRRIEASLQNTLANLYDELGEPAQSRACCERALAVAREMGMRSGEASTLTTLSRMCRDVGDVVAAEANAAAALQASRESDNPMAEAFARRILGLLALDRGDLQEARAQLEATLALFERLAQPRGEGSLHGLLAEVRARAGEPEAALAEGEQSLRLARATKDAQLEAMSQSWLALHHLETGDRAAAVDAAREAVRVSESLRQRISQPDWRASYLATVQGRYQLLIDALLAGADGDTGARDAAAVEEAFEASERARARSLLDLLAEARVDVREGADPQLLAQERELRRKIELAAAEQRRGDAPATELDRLTVAMHELEARMRVACPRFAALVRPEPLTTAAIQQELLDDGSVLLEVALGEERSWLFVATRADVAAFPLPPEAALTTLAHALRDAATARAPREGEAAAERRERVRLADASFATASAELSRLLLAPAAAQLADDWDGARLVLVAPGALQQVPFAALPEPGAAAGAPVPLIAAHELVRLPSASVLAALRRETAERPPAGRALALFADPVFERDDPRVAATTRADGSAPVNRGAFQRLPFTRDEARQIAALVPRESLLEAIGFDASRERALGGELADCRIVHFATHGVLDDQHPELSGLVLSLVDRDGAPQAGFFQLSDVCNLKLRAELVVLSACQTALGREVRGEGLIGLTRGFMYAGARRVVASLWHVDDLATADLMRRFYRGIFEGRLAPAAALRAAQAELAADARWSAPWYWAGFVLQGEWN